MKRRPAKVRPILVLAHRWLGLVMAGFLLLAGVTGSMLVWNDELDAAINPGLFKVAAPAGAARPMDPLVLRERVLALYPQAQMLYVPLQYAAGSSARFRIEARPDHKTGKTAELPNDEVFLDPFTGAVLGERRWGDITQGMKNLMPFIYRLHYSLALDVVGTYLLGIISLMWTIDCFVGACLTFPSRRRSKAHESMGRHQNTWLIRWWQSWKVRWSAGAYKLNVDLHRAGGLWTWAMLFVFAWSSVSFNLSEVYSPVMRLLFPRDPALEQLLSRPAQKQAEPGIPWAEARETGRKHMADFSRRAGFDILEEGAMAYVPARAVYRYDVRSSLDIRDHGSKTRVYFDANTGVLRLTTQPTGANAGDTVGMWLTSLHMGALWGWPFRIFICVLGLVVAVLSATGIYIWHKKRTSRKHSAARIGRDR